MERRHLCIPYRLKRIKLSKVMRIVGEFRALLGEKSPSGSVQRLLGDMLKLGKLYWVTDGGDI